MAVYEIVGHELSANQWGTSIVLYLSNYYSPHYRIAAYYLQNGTWKEATSGRAFYENCYTFNIPTNYDDDNITVRIRETNINTGQSTYTSSYTLSIKPKVIGHEIDSLNNEILLLLDGDYSWEFIAMAAIRDYKGDLVHITDNASMSHKGITVDYPNNAGTVLTFETRLVHKEFNYIFDMDNYSLYLLPIPEITGHFPTNPIAGDTVTLYLNSDFRNVPWELEYRSGGSRWETMPSSNITMYASSMTVLIPETFTGSTITFGLGVDRGSSNYIYSADYDITMGVRTDRIQYNQSGTIRNMEAKYNHNGVIKNVECWYNHNGVLKKVQ